MLREGSLVAQGLLAESSGSDVQWDGGQGMDIAPCLSLAFIRKFSRILSIASTVSSLHPLVHKGVLLAFLQSLQPKCCEVSGAGVQEIPTAAASCEVS